MRLTARHARLHYASRSIVRIGDDYDLCEVCGKAVPEHCRVGTRVCSEKCRWKARYAKAKARAQALVTSGKEE